MWTHILVYSYFRIYIQHYKYPSASFKALKLRNGSDAVLKWDSIMMFAMFVTHSSILFICTLLSAIHFSFHINAYDIKELKQVVCLLITLKQTGARSLPWADVLEKHALSVWPAPTNNLQPHRVRAATILSRAPQVWRWRKTWFTVHELRAGSVAGGARDNWAAMLTCDMGSFLCIPNIWNIKYILFYIKIK